jgi:hypothetical protein
MLWETVLFDLLLKNSGPIFCFDKHLCESKRTWFIYWADCYGKPSSRVKIDLLWEVWEEWSTRQFVNIESEVLLRALVAFQSWTLPRQAVGDDGCKLVVPWLKCCKGSHKNAEGFSLDLWGSNCREDAGCCCWSFSRSRRWLLCYSYNEFLDILQQFLDSAFDGKPKCSCSVDCLDKSHVLVLLILCCKFHIENWSFWQDRKCMSSEYVVEDVTKLVLES